MAARLNIHTGDLKRTLPLKQQQRQKPGAAAKVTDPEAGAQPRQGGEQKGVRTGAEQTVLPDEAEPAGTKLFPMHHKAASSPENRFLLYMEAAPAQAPKRTTKNRSQDGA